MSNKHLPRLFAQALNEKRLNSSMNSSTRSTTTTTHTWNRARLALKPSFGTTSTHFPTQKL